MPADCLGCHKSLGDPPFSSLIHLAHFARPDTNVFVERFGGDCRHCHVMDDSTGFAGLKRGERNGQGRRGQPRGEPRSGAGVSAFGGSCSWRIENAYHKDGTRYVSPDGWHPLAVTPPDVRSAVRQKQAVLRPARGLRFHRNRVNVVVPIWRVLVVYRND